MLILVNCCNYWYIKRNLYLLAMKKRDYSSIFQLSIKNKQRKFHKCDCESDNYL